MLDSPWKYVGIIVKEVNFEQKQNWKISVSLPLPAVPLLVLQWPHSSSQPAPSHFATDCHMPWESAINLSDPCSFPYLRFKRGWEWKRVWWRSHCWTSALYLFVLNPMLCLLLPLPLLIHFVSLWNHYHCASFLPLYIQFPCSLALCPSSTLNRTSCPSHSWLVAFWKW